MSQFVVTSLAQEDLDEIWLHIADNSENIADSFIDELFERFVLIGQFPQMGRERDELAVGLRSFPLRRYLIFYRVIDNGIEIVRVLHSARDIETIL